MFEPTQSLFEFETKQKGYTYCLRFVRQADLFWLEREDLDDWRAFLPYGGIWDMVEKAFFTFQQDRLKTLVQQAVENHQLMRAFAWGEEQRFFVGWQSRSHCWLDARSHAVEDFNSRTAWHKGPFWTAPGSFFRHQFEREWQDPECDARDALDYLQTPHSEQQRRAVVWLHGGWKEVEQVVSAAMKIEFDEATTLRHAPDYDSMKLVWVLHPQGETPPERLQRLLAVVDERNPRDPHGKRSKRRGGYMVEVPISTPSMHDKLEARLFLLDWLREHAPQLLSDWA